MTLSCLDIELKHAVSSLSLAEILARLALPED